MSDVEKPLFFGGLPPRDAIATSAADTAPAAERESWSVLAIVALVGSLFVSVVGIVCGYLALRRIRRTGERGRRVALAGMLIGFVGLAISIAMLGVLVAGGPKLVSAIAGVEPRHSSVAVIAPKVSPSEAAAAKAAIAAGGGAIPGHIVSAQLCTAVKNYFALGSGANSSTSVSPQALAAMEQLAAVPSPYQPRYQAYLALVKDPASVSKVDQAQKLAADFAKAVQVDVTTCA